MINRGATVRLHAIRGTKLLIEGVRPPSVTLLNARNGNLEICTSIRVSNPSFLTSILADDASVER